MKKLLLLLSAALAIYSTNTFSQVSIDWLRYINDHPEGDVSIACDNANNTYALGTGEAVKPASYNILINNRHEKDNHAHRLPVMVSPDLFAHILPTGSSRPTTISNQAL